MRFENCDIRDIDLCILVKGLTTNVNTNARIDHKAEDSIAALSFPNTSSDGMNLPFLYSVYTTLVHRTAHDDPNAL